MDNKINTQNTGLRVQIDQSRVRQAPKTDFGSMVGAGLSKTADAVMNAGQLAAPFIPGGAVLSAAITGVGSLKSSASGQSSSGLGSSSSGMAMGANSTSLVSSTGISGSVGGSGGTAPTGATSGGDGNMFAQMRAYQAESMSMNVQYLKLQNDMQQENRQFTTLSNVMKTKHDTAKNAINNVR